jgi:hypothetical protein
MNKVQEVTEFLKKNPSFLKRGKANIACRLGCTVEEVKEAKRLIGINTNNKEEYSEYVVNVKSVITGGKTIIEKGLPELSPLQAILSETKIPESEVDRYWYKGKNFSIHAKTQSISPEEQFKYLIEEAKKQIEPIELIEKAASKGNCAVINIYDIHLDKRDVKNSNAGNDGTKSLVKELEEGFASLLSSVLINQPDTFILPVGNDLFTTNGFLQATKKGTPQDPSVTHEVIFKEGLSLMRNFIDILSNFGVVYVPIIYGNHSADAEFYLGVCLEALYWNNEKVIINNTKRARKYIQYEDNLFGFGHGDLEKKNIDKLPLIMATENPQLWGNTKHRVFYLGDVHHKEEFKFFRTKDNPGCIVQFLRSTSVTDSWHEDNMFVGVPRSMEASIWSSKKGQIANYLVNL